MERRTKMVVGVGVVGLGLATLGAGAAVAGGNDDDESPIQGDELERASDAALAHTGEGEVTETEVGDEESYYEVEVTLDDGTQVDVQLNEQFEVVGSENDSDSAEDQD